MGVQMEVGTRRKETRNERPRESLRVSDEGREHATG